MLGYHANWKFMGSPDKVSTVALQRQFSILLDQKAIFFCASKISSNLRHFIAPMSKNANMQIDRSHSAEKGLRTQLESSLQNWSSLISWYLLTEASQCPNFCPRSCCVCDRAEIWDQPSIWVLALCYFAGRSPNLSCRGLLLRGGGVRTQLAQLIFESKDRFCGKVHDQHIGLALSLLWSPSAAKRSVHTQQRR